jgi:linoleoyl-CoA desaturase
MRASRTSRSSMAKPISSTRTKSYGVLSISTVQSCARAHGVDVHGKLSGRHIGQRRGARAFDREADHDDSAELRQLGGMRRLLCANARWLASATSQGAEVALMPTVRGRDATQVVSTIPRPTPPTGPRFGSDTSLYRALKAEVARCFDECGRSPRADWRFALKAAIVLSAAALQYILLVFAASTWWQALPLMIGLGLAVATIGFNVGHDGGHGTVSRHATLNRAAAFAFDICGGSSYVWRFKHNRIHHQYTNIEGIDADIDAEPFLRLAPNQRRRAWHRYQHWYAWALYGLLIVKWHLVDDFRDVLTGRVGARPMPRPRGMELGLFVLGKLILLTLAFGLPLVSHPLLHVVVGYLVVAGTTGLVLGTVFQLAHCVGEADFPAATVAGGRLPTSWAEHQLATTVDFARDSRVLGWLLGGLNFQVEHHLFSYVSHVHYWALSPVFARACREHRVVVREQPSLWQALRSHGRWLERMGRSDPLA